VDQALYIATALTFVSGSYLGDALIHLSFPILLFGSDMLAPLELLGPIANYLFLRFVGGDAELEPDQTRRYSMSAPSKMAQLDEYRQEKNSFWPALSEVKNQWTWVIFGCGALAVGLEEAARRILL
jgi:steroid 5-alpha reductase family enzyme